MPPLHRCNSQTSFDYSSPDLNIFPITVCLWMYENVANIFLFQSKFAAMVTKYAISHRGWIWNPNRWRNPQGRCQSQPCSDQAQDGRVQQEPAVGTLLQVKPNLIFTSPFRQDVENEGLDISDLEILAGNAESSQHHENSQAALHHRYHRPNKLAAIHFKQLYQILLVSEHLWYLPHLHGNRFFGDWAVNCSHTVI